MSYIDELQKRYESEGKGIVRITNKDLVCKDCLYRHDDSVIFGNTSRCDFYPTQKPNSILHGKDCTYYFKGDKNHVHIKTLSHHDLGKPK